MDKAVIENTSTWFAMPIEKQLCNVGSEVHRAIRYKNKGDRQKSENFCNKAIDFLVLCQEDKKNRNRVEELEALKEELQDYFLGKNIYNTTDDILIRYYDSFMWRAYGVGNE